MVARAVRMRAMCVRAMRACAVRACVGLVAVDGAVEPQELVLPVQRLQLEQQERGEQDRKARQHDVEDRNLRRRRQDWLLALVRGGRLLTLKAPR